MKNQYAKKVDNNQAAIIEALTRAGYPVKNTSAFGRGFPDLFVGSKSFIFVAMEVKQPGEKLTAPEQDFFIKYDGYPAHIVYDLEEALEVMYHYDKQKAPDLPPAGIG